MVVVTIAVAVLVVIYVHILIRPLLCANITLTKHPDLKTALIITNTTPTPGWITIYNSICQRVNVFSCSDVLSNLCLLLLRYRRVQWQFDLVAWCGHFCAKYDHCVRGGLTLHWRWIKHAWQVDQFLLSSVCLGRIVSTVWRYVYVVACRKWTVLRINIIL